MSIKSTIGRSNHIWKLFKSVLPAAAAEQAVRRFATPPRFIASTPRYWHHAVRRRELRTGAGPVVLYSHGAGPRVLLVHGWGSAAAQLDAFVEPLLAEGFGVVAFDAPGHGAVAASRSSIVEFARAISAIADSEGPFRAVVAHSLGAGAAALALARGVTVERAVLVSPLVEPRAHFERFVAALGLPLQRSLALAERRYGIAWSDVDVASHARGLAVPLLVVHDRNDRVIAFEEGEKLASAWSGARLLETRGLGHRRILTDAEVIAATCRFLSAPPVALAAGA